MQVLASAANHHPSVDERGWVTWPDPSQAADVFSPRSSCFRFLLHASPSEPAEYTIANQSHQQILACRVSRDYSSWSSFENPAFFEWRDGRIFPRLPEVSYMQRACGASSRTWTHLFRSFLNRWETLFSLISSFLAVAFVFWQFNLRPTTSCSNALFHPKIVRARLWGRSKNPIANMRKRRCCRKWIVHQSEGESKGYLLEERRLIIVACS